MLAKGTAIKNTMRLFRKKGCPEIPVKEGQEYVHIHPRSERLVEPILNSNNGLEGTELRRKARVLF